MQEPLSIVLASPTSGASWTFTVLLAGALPLDRFRVTVAAIGPAPDREARHELAQLAPHATLAVLEGPGDAEPEPWTALDETRGRLRLLCERVKPRLLHTNHVLVGPGECGVRSVATVADDLAARARVLGPRPGGPDLSRFRAEAKERLLRADVVVAPSAWSACEHERAYKLPAAVRVIRAGVAAAPRSVVERGLAAVAIGPLEDPGRHFDWLLAVAARMPGPVGIVGPKARSLPHPLEALGPLGHRDRVALLGGTRVFLGLARFDPYGLEAAEAEAAGARLVLVDTPTHRELFRSTAELVRDAESLALATGRAFAAPRLARPTTPHHAIGQTAAAYARLFEELAS